MDARGLWALVCVLAVVGCSVALVPAVSASASGTGGADAAPGEPTLQEEPNETAQLTDADEIHIDVFLQQNGSATFVVDYRFENDTDGNWVTIAEDVEENPDAYTAEEADRWNEVLEDGENATDREMELGTVSVETDTSPAPRELGHVTFTFEWESFAHVELNRIEAGGALAGFTLPKDTTLQVFPPEGYVVDDVDPSPEDQPDESVFWDGDGTEFTDDQPWITVIENGNGAGPPDDDPGPEMPWLAVAVALALLASVGAAGWWIRHEGIKTDTDATTTASDHPAEGDPAEESQPNGTPPELLSNEERVLRLLEQRGGRIKQQNVVSELDWTEAKTSQVVSGLREDDEIEVFRIGRENVLALPDEDRNGE